MRIFNSNFELKLRNEGLRHNKAGTYGSKELHHGELRYFMNNLKFWLQVGYFCAHMSKNITNVGPRNTLAVSYIISIYNILAAKRIENDGCSFL